MSGSGFHVHGPHDHELEHAAQGHGHAAGESKSFIGQIAVVTAVIATIGAIFSYMGGATQSNAGLYKNNAAIKKTEAANKWSYYQSKSSKQNLAALAAEIVPEERRAKYLKDVERYEGEKTVINAEAKKLEEEATLWDKKSDDQLHEHHRWAQATTALQIAIAMAAIALLTRKRWLEYAMFGVAGIGVVVGVLAAMHI